MDQSAVKDPRLPFIRGTKPSLKNSQLLISSGIPSLDHTLGTINAFQLIHISSIFSTLLLLCFRWWITCRLTISYRYAQGIVD